MKHTTYLEIARGQLGLGPDAGLEDLEEEAMRQMEAAGYAVLRNRMSDGSFRVRVQESGDRHTVRRLYNEHTTSTSSYPILRAWEKWQVHRAESGGAS